MTIYMDDILIATQTIEHHLEILERVLKTLSENLLELRINKCYFLQTEVEYLGYLVSAKGMKPTRSGIEAVEKFPIPNATKILNAFLHSAISDYLRSSTE